MEFERVFVKPSINPAKVFAVFDRNCPVAEFSVMYRRRGHIKEGYRSDLAKIQA